MRIAEATAVAVRVLGVFLVFYLLAISVQSFSLMVAMPHQAEMSLMALLIWGGTLGLMLLVALWMVLRPDVLARWLVPDIADDSPLIREDGASLQVVGITLIGVYVLIGTVPHFFNNIYYLWIQDQLYMDLMSRQRGELIMTQWVTVLEMALALFCVLGARGIVRVIAWLRGRNP